MRKVARSSRDGRVAQWLGALNNPAVNGLALELDGDGDSEPEVVQTWDLAPEDQGPWKTVFDPARVAEQVCSLLDNLADETQSSVSARLIWTVDGKPFTRFPVRAEAASEGIASQRFEPSTKSVLVQTQRHSEAMASQYFKATQAAIDTFDRTMNVLTTAFETREERYAALEARVAQLADENNELRAQVTELEHVAERAVEQGEEAADELEQARARGEEDSQLSKVLQIGMRQAMQGAPKKDGGST